MDGNEATTMLREATSDILAMMFYADELSQHPEGQVYLRLVSEGARHGLEWAHKMFEEGS